jgi:hypothetical protein
MNNKFNWQSFISIALLFAFILMLVSGIVLYIAPEGSLSRWIGWDILNLTKKQWEHQHTIFSYLFILFSVLHIFKINWGLLISYFQFDKKRFTYLREIIIALVIVLFVFIGTLFNWKPFSSVIKWGSNISDNYATGVEYPNVSDAEKLSLDKFATTVFQISYADFKAYTKEYEFTDLDKNSTVYEFCEINDITPEELYRHIKQQLLANDSKGSVGNSTTQSFLDNSTIL